MKSRVAVTAALAVALISILALVSCEKPPKAPEQAQQAGQAPAAEQRVEKNPDRNAYFGEEHIHTSWSVDAWVMGNRGVLAAVGAGLSASAGERDRVIARMTARESTPTIGITKKVRRMSGSLPYRVKG